MNNLDFSNSGIVAGLPAIGVHDATVSDVRLSNGRTDDTIYISCTFTTADGGVVEAFYPLTGSAPARMAQITRGRRDVAALLAAAGVPEEHRRVAVPEDLVPLLLGKAVRVAVAHRGSPPEARVAAVMPGATDR